MELKPRPMSAVPTDAALLLATVRQAYPRESAGLAQALSGVSDDRAGRQPAGGEWSAKEVLAHLSVAERDLHYEVGKLLMGEEPVQTAGRSRVPEKTAAVLATAPTVAALLDRLAGDQAGTLALLAALRPEIAANKARCHRIGQRVLDLPDHLHEHAEQIRAALASG